MSVTSAARNSARYPGGENKGKHKRESADNSVVNRRIRQRTLEQKGMQERTKKLSYKGNILEIIPKRKVSGALAGLFFVLWSEYAHSNSANKNPVNFASFAHHEQKKARANQSASVPKKTVKLELIDWEAEPKKSNVEKQSNVEPHELFLKIEMMAEEQLAAWKDLLLMTVQIKKTCLGLN